MCKNVFKTFSNELRPFDDFILVDNSLKVYLDPSLWCIHGNFEDFDTYIVPNGAIVAKLISIFPYAISWVGDLHVGSDFSEKCLTVIDNLSKINPFINIINGDLVAGSGEYLGSNISNNHFNMIWNTLKNKLSNMFWTKGNHDIDPGRLYYYNWFTRTWCLDISPYKLIAIDTYNEQCVIPGSSYSFMSYQDVMHLRELLHLDNRKVIIVSHHPYDNWFMYTFYAFKNASPVLVLSSHYHGIAMKEWLGVKCFINGSCGPDSKLPVTSILLLDNSNYKVINVAGKLLINCYDNYFEIHTPPLINYEFKKLKGEIPIRLKIKIESKLYINLLLLLPSESFVKVYVKKNKQMITVSCDYRYYVIGKQVKCSKGVLHSYWRCPLCGTLWTSYMCKGSTSIEVSN